MQKSFYGMPAKEEMLSVLTITHEYGHMLEAAIVRQNISAELLEKVEKLKAQGKRREAKKLLDAEESKQCRAIYNEIVDIAKADNENFVLKENLSQYGYTNIYEAFAEIFANSQCGAPNMLGKAMNKWLKKEGY